jgi:heterodisulfide reductase subunit C
MKPALHAVYPPVEERRRTAEICLRCGVCCTVSHRCHVMFDRRFTPTYTFVYDCLEAERPAYNANIWLCVSCHKCEETCPYDVAPINFIEAMREQALKNGVVNNIIGSEVQQIISSGYAFPLTPTTERMRQGLGLKSIKPRGVEELRVISRKTGLVSRITEANP